MQKHGGHQSPVFTALEQPRNDRAQADHFGVAGKGLGDNFESEDDSDDDEQSGRDRRKTFHSFSTSADMRRKIA